VALVAALSGMVGRFLPGRSDDGRSLPGRLAATTVTATTTRPTADGCRRRITPLTPV